MWRNFMSRSKAKFCFCSVKYGIKVRPICRKKSMENLCTTKVTYINGGSLMVWARLYITRKMRLVIIRGNFRARREMSFCNHCQSTVQDQTLDCQDDNSGPTQCEVYQRLPHSTVQHNHVAWLVTNAGWRIGMSFHMQVTSMVMMCPTVVAVCGSSTC